MDKIFKKQMPEAGADLCLWFCFSEVVINNAVWMSRELFAQL